MVATGNGETVSDANPSYHLGTEPGIRSIRVLNQDGRVTLSTEDRGEGKRGRVLTVTRRIDNSPDCSNAACHSATTGKPC